MIVVCVNCEAVIAKSDGDRKWFVVCLQCVTQHEHEQDNRTKKLQEKNEQLMKQLDGYTRTRASGSCLS